LKKVFESPRPLVRLYGDLLKGTEACLTVDVLVMLDLCVES